MAVYSAFSVTDVLNQWNQYGIFSYVLPFLIIFGVVFAILEKTKILGDSSTAKNVKGINAVIAIAIGLMALLNDQVSTFFATIFPRFGIVLSIFIVLLILIGFFYKPDEKGTNKSLAWIGWVLGIGVVIWAWSDWQDLFGQSFQIQQFMNDYFWGIVVLLAVGALLYWMTRGESK